MPTVCHLKKFHRFLDTRIFYKEALSGRRAGYRVAIIGSANENLHDEVEGVQLYGYRRRRLPRGIGRLHMLTNMLRLGLRVDADIYHVHEPRLLLAAVLLKLGQRLRGKRTAVVHDVHDFYLHEGRLDDTLGPSDRLKLRIQQRWDRGLHRLCDFVIGAEESKLARARSYGFSESDSAVIENYVPLDRFEYCPKRFAETQFVVGYVGGLSFQRGLDTLAEACLVLAERTGIRPTLLLAGHFVSAEAQHWLRQFRVQHARAIEVDWRGRVPYLDVPQIMAEMDVGCALFYSRRYDRVLSTDAGPIKLYEYMASGTPVVATNQPALKKTIEECRCGQVVGAPDGPGAVADALVSYFCDPNRMRQDAYNGRTAVERRYNWSWPEQELLEVYRQLIEQVTSP